MDIQTIPAVKSILIIEDNSGDVRIIEEILKEANSSLFKVNHCGTLSEGINLLKENDYDALILDLRLPDSSDLETLKIIRENNNTIPIIVLTIISNEELGLASIQNGAQDFLVKEKLESSSLEKSIKFAIERKKLEQKINTTERLFEATFEQAAVGMAHVTAEGKIVKINKRCCDITGYDKEELIGRKIDFFSHKDDIKFDLSKMSQLLNGEVDNYDFEKRIIKKDGSIIWVHITRSLIKPAEKNPLIFTVVEDINIKKRTEHILTLAFENYKTLAENSPDIINRFDKNLNCLYTNPSVRKIVGKNPDEMIGRNLADYAEPEKFEVWQKRFKEVFETKERQYYQDIFNADGNETTLETIFVPECDENDNITSILTISRDITERLQAQEEIQRKNLLLEKILQNIPAGVWIIDENGNLIIHNKACERIWGGLENMAIRKKPEFKGWWAESGQIIKDKEWASFRAYSKGETSLNEIINIECYDGTKKTIINSAVPMLDADRKVIGVVVINQDITDLMKIENDLKALIEEKEMLMKEIHHRVKNNFQIISSLLSLQRSSIKDKSIDEVLLESQNRVNSMAILHEKLYRSKNLHSLNFGVYLQGLLNSLESSYKIPGRSIKFQFDFDEVIVSTDYAINLGLIVNELVSNSLKHAFNGRDKGIIAITLKSDGENKLKINVKDDGIGIDKNIDIMNTDSLGMLLITSFVKQINGEIKLKRENGTEYEIVFPKE